jgi:hypothetical protein
MDLVYVSGLGARGFGSTSGYKSKRDSSLRKPTASQERSGKKKRRLAPFGMTGCGVDEKDEGGERGKNEFGEHEGRGLG